MIVNTSRIVRYLTAIGTPDPWGAHDRATIAQLTMWAEAAQEWEADEPREICGQCGMRYAARGLTACSTCGGEWL